ncbi:MAG: glycosyltransferase family 4 protein [Lachnospiraceae bacterium]
MKKKKICFIAQFPPPIHGLSKAVETLYYSRLREDYEFEKINITSNKAIIGNLLKILKSNARLYYFTISQTRGGNLRDLLIFKLLRIQGKECLVHLHGGYYRRLVEEKLPKWQKRANYRAVSGLAGVIVLSDSLKSIFQDMLPEEKIHVVENCVDDEFLMDEAEFQRKMDSLLASRFRQVLYLSNFIPEKGYRQVLELARYVKENPEAVQYSLTFAFAGKFFEPEEERFFHDYCRQYGLEELVTYYGVVGGEQKRELLKSSQLFILPTRYPNEGQPISILEAMGNAMVIITTDHAGIPDVVKDEENGLIIKCREMQAEEVCQFLNKMDEAFIMKANRRLIMEKYRQDNYLNGVRECWEKIFRQRDVDCKTEKNMI